MKKIVYLSIIGMALLMGACTHTDYTPKPKAYLRFDMPEKAYHTYDTAALPFTFECADSAYVVWKQNDRRTKYLDIFYPQYQGVINLTYKAVKDENDLRALIDTASRMLALHHDQASGEKEATLLDPKGRVYATIVKLNGKNTGCTYQFWLTDSTRHFLRGALFLNYTPNNDSLAPVIEYLQADIDQLVETLQWRD